MAVTRLVAGAINDHILGCQTWAWPGEEPFRDPSTCEGCCPECCAPCAALAWFRDEADDWLTEWLNAWWPNHGCVWQNPDGSVNWKFIEVHWKPDTLGCHDEGDHMDNEVESWGLTPEARAAYDALPDSVKIEVAAVMADPTQGVRVNGVWLRHKPVADNETTVDLSELPEAARAYAEATEKQIAAGLRVVAATGFPPEMTASEADVARVQANLDAQPEVKERLLRSTESPETGVRRQRPVRRLQEEAAADPSVPNLEIRPETRARLMSDAAGAALAADGTL